MTFLREALSNRGEGTASRLRVSLQEVTVPEDVKDKNVFPIGFSSYVLGGRFSSGDLRRVEWTPSETVPPSGVYLFFGTHLNLSERLEEYLPKWFDSLGSLFGGKSAGASDRELNELAAEAERASPGARWAVFNRLGDAYLKADDRTRALRYFGKSIDALLEDDQPEPARAVAKKVIRLHPEAIRTLCTLTWLDLASMKLAEAKVSLANYVKAAKEGNREHLACAQILEMARLIPDADYLKRAIEALDYLGCPAESAQVKAWLTAGVHESTPVDKKRLHLLCLKGAIGSNVKLKNKGALT